MQVAIVGAGLTGLTAAYELSKRGLGVTVFEKESCAGGLARGFRRENWDWSLEHYFHHIFTSDAEIIDLIRELGLGERLFFWRPKTSIYYEGGETRTKIHRFDSPLSVLQFSPLSFPERLRVGLATAYLKYWPFFTVETGHLSRGAALRDAPPLLKCFIRSSALQRAPLGLGKVAAAEYLPKLYGNHAYKILWEPLLKAKFGKYYDQIAASWFWARIKKRSARLGYLEGGFQVLVDRLVGRIKENGGEVYLDREITCFNDLNSVRLEKFNPDKSGVEFFVSRTNPERRHAWRAGVEGSKFDAIVFAIPVSEFLKVISAGRADDLGRGRETAAFLNPSGCSNPKGFPAAVSLEMVGALALVLELDEPFLTDDTYWLNINEPDFPFVAVVEHTNFVDPAHYGGKHILYAGGYYPQNHKYFEMDEEGIFAEFLPYLKEINSGFSFRLNAERCRLTADPYAQPVIPTNYSQIAPNVETPFDNIYLANMQTIYPWDRGMNYAVELGRRVAEKIADTGPISSRELRGGGTM